MIDAINSVNLIDRINHINPGVLNCISLQMKDISNDPKNYGITFWDKKGDLSRLLEFTGICKAFMRSVQKMNKIPLGVLNINSSG